MKDHSSTKLSEYKPYPFLIPDINLDFNIDDEKVFVQASMLIVPKSEESKILILKGTEIELISLSINGKELHIKEYNLSANDLVINKTPNSKFELNIKSWVYPYKNSSLEGLYLSSGMLASQCEAEGFRRTCFHPDRPDVLSKYKVRIESDKNKFPILLSNGNKKYSGILNKNKNRHEIIWEDPFPKPSYLFALVAGKLSEVSDTYTTSSGRLIDIKL